MIGFLDEQSRALIAVPVGATQTGNRSQLIAWIDTAFNGGLVIPRRQIESLGLAQESTADAILADGSTVLCETFACFFDWFGATFETQVVASDCEFPLLGTMLLANRKLEIDYKAKTVHLN